MPTNFLTNPKCHEGHFQKRRSKTGALYPEQYSIILSSPQNAVDKYISVLPESSDFTFCFDELQHTLMIPLLFISQAHAGTITL